jgi:hypothetical protein
VRGAVAADAGREGRQTGGGSPAADAGRPPAASPGGAEPRCGLPPLADGERPWRTG